MYDLPPEEFNLLMGSRKLGQSAYMLNTICSWIGLKILDHLLRAKKKERAGQIASAINLRIEDVIKTLETLQSLDIVCHEVDAKEGSKYWYMKDDRFCIRIEGTNSGMRVTHEERTVISRLKRILSRS